MEKNKTTGSHQNFKYSGTDTFKSDSLCHWRAIYFYEVTTKKVLPFIFKNSDHMPLLWLFYLFQILKNLNRNKADTTIPRQSPFLKDQEIQTDHWQPYFNYTTQYCFGFQIRSLNKTKPHGTLPCNSMRWDLSFCIWNVLKWRLAILPLLLLPRASWQGSTECHQCHLKGRQMTQHTPQTVDSTKCHI